MSRGVIEIFPKGTGPKIVETRALPVIWVRAEDFQDKAIAMNAAAARLVNISAAGDRNAIVAQFKALGQTCGACHKQFRQKKQLAWKPYAWADLEIQFLAAMVLVQTSDEFAIAVEQFGRNFFFRPQRPFLGL